MHHPRQTAQVSLAFLIASAITLAMLLLTLVMVGQSFRGMEGAKITATSAAARQLATSVDDRIDAISAPPATALAVLSHDPLGKAQTIPQRMERLAVIADVLQSSDIVSAVYAGYDDGDFFMLRKVRHSDASTANSLPDGTGFVLQTVTREAGTITGTWHFYDAAMQRISHQDMPEYQFDPRQRPWFLAAEGSDTTVLSAPYIFFTTHETGLTLSRRSANHGPGYPTAIFGIDVTVSDLSDQLAALRQTPGTHITIVNRDRQVLADSAGDSEPRTVIAGALDKAGYALDDSPVTRFQADGQDWYGITEPLKALAKENLTIAVAIPEDELLADVWAAMFRQTTIAGGIALVLLAVGWFLGHRVGRPLELLTERVAALSRFRFDTQVQVESHIREARELGSALDDMASTIRSFQNIATTLNRGQDLTTLLRDILDQIIQILGQRRGAVYLFNRKSDELRRAVDHQLECPKTIPDVRDEADDSDLIHSLREQLGGHPVFAILRNRQKQLVGALVVEMEEGEHTHLSDDLIVFVDEIAGSAAVAIETRELIESQQALLDGIIRLVAGAIDAKSPYTSGHCERVPKLAQMLVSEAEASTEEPFRDFRMTDAEAYEFHLAAWLHDCGKITIPEYVVDKASKLETIYNRIHEIRTRFEVLHRDAEIDYLHNRLAGSPEDEARLRRDSRQQQLQEDFAFVADCNLGGEEMSDEAAARLEAIGKQAWLRHFSDRLGLSNDERQILAGTPEVPPPATASLLEDRPDHIQPWTDRIPPVTRDDPRNRWGFDMKLPAHAYNRGELYNLTIRHGTLTPEERFKINEHIVQTICMLDALPLPDWLAGVPRLAGTHHERMDGEGYPCRLAAADLGIPERIMAVADVFEALTAIDRPYKDGKPLSEALTIMARMVREQHLDADVYNLFVRSGVYRRYAEQHMQPEQIDVTDEGPFLVT